MYQGRVIFPFSTELTQKVEDLSLCCSSFCEYLEGWHFHKSQASKNQRAKGGLEVAWQVPWSIL